MHLSLSLDASSIAPRGSSLFSTFSVINRNCPTMSASNCSRTPAHIALHRPAGYSCASFALPLSNLTCSCWIHPLRFGHIFPSRLAMQSELDRNPILFLAGPSLLPLLALSPYRRWSPTTRITPCFCSSCYMHGPPHDDAVSGCPCKKYRPFSTCILYNCSHKL